MKFNSQVVLVAAGVLLSLEGFNIQAAQAITFNLNWTGQYGGYSAKGKFSYDENLIPEDGVIRKNNITAFDIGFYNPDGSLIENFVDNHLTYPLFNFNFDTKTKQVLQDGIYYGPRGLDIGFSKNVSGFPKGSIRTGIPEGIAMWTSGPIEPLGIHIHLSGYGDEYSRLPITFHGLMDFLDIAFFTLTQKQGLDATGQNSTNADNTRLGQTLEATQVPEPSGLAGIVTLGFIGLFPFVERRLRKN
ncbi:PEP-CTERM sorting domain-containing protein [Aphanothece sacrum]|uniref:PEP motif-containing protein n=1 Tax=Aphanothece sacrum FPU1 TaxID=1920663 RepID=A0A401IDB1_APHSA|nr:PEP-CTERM sorting domain-containing protein [Aphanothece sacrum]GBF79179.1 PEP motif-containing protein [Aphanothece sacrum FPU1]GBF86568.1 hypothetical protein AsFPU3_3639 [Aphanothece sacrum FPU3]